MTIEVVGAGHAVEAVDAAKRGLVNVQIIYTLINREIKNYGCLLLCLPPDIFLFSRQSNSFTPMFLLLHTKPLLYSFMHVPY